MVDPLVIIINNSKQNTETINFFGCLEIKPYPVFLRLNEWIWLLESFS